MTTWMDKPVFVAQGHNEERYKAPVPLPDKYPEEATKSLSYWIRDHRIDLDEIWATKALPSDVDVVIIGSGISGAAAVYELTLKQPHLRIALLEARGICTGATGRNGGHISRPECYEFIKTGETWGAEEAIRLKSFAIRNRDMMLGAIDDLGIADKVDLRLTGTVVVFETKDEHDTFMADWKYAKDHGYEPENVYLTPEETAMKYKLDPSKTQYGAAFLARSGTIHPRKLVHSLLQTALEKASALTLHPHTTATSIEIVGEGSSQSYKVITRKGTINTRAVFHATNGYAGSICPSLHGPTGVFGCKAHMLAIRPNQEQTPGQLIGGFGYAEFWHWIHQRPNQGPFLYGLADAELLNDYDDTISIPTDHPVREKMKKFLETVFQPYFKNVDDKVITHDWTGVQGFTMTGASIVGRVAVDRPGEFASVGHNGEGMTRCFASAYVAAQGILAYLDGKGFEVPEWFPHTYRRNI